MSDTPGITTPDPTRECAMCGLEGVPSTTCEKCGGRAGSQPRQYTLSQLAGMSTEKREEILRGDRPSGAGPRIVNFPGSA